MPITVDLAVAAARFEQLVAKAEAGEEVVICRDGAPVVRLTVFAAELRHAAIEKAIEEVRAFRARRKPVTAEELIAWKNEGRRY